MVGIISVPAFVLAKSAGVLTRAPEITSAPNSQTMSLLAAFLNINPTSVGGPAVSIIDGTTLSSSSDEGTVFIDPGQQGTGQIGTYVVREGDTISEIAEMFGVSANTIRWANDLSGSVLKIGQELVILPISGVRHTVKSGDTLASIAKKYKADLDDIVSYNGVSADAKLSVGDIVIVPDGVLGSSGANLSQVSNQAVASGYYLRPIRGGVKTQDIHGYNGVDIGAPTGTPIMASADGTVIIARTSGYNGGYGLYVAIKHGNGTQTVYAHMSRIDVVVGERVEQGQIIGAVGSTGRSTGPHLHFEVRGARNPF